MKSVPLLPPHIAELDIIEEEPMRQAAEVVIEQENNENGYHELQN